MVLIATMHVASAKPLEKMVKIDEAEEYSCDVPCANGWFNNIIKTQECKDCLKKRKDSGLD
jgi:hypothetical protein